MLRIKTFQNIPFRMSIMLEYNEMNSTTEFTKKKYSSAFFHEFYFNDFNFIVLCLDIAI